jgi:fibronectin type 3 domain-containing protein
MKKFHSFFMLLVLASVGALGLLRPATIQAAGNADRYRIVASSGPQAGQVTLRWNEVETVDTYHLVYGTSKTNMQYGVLDVGKNRVYTVKSLNPGATYYFAVVPVFNNQALYTTAAVGRVAAAGTVVAEKPATTVAKVGQPTAAVSVAGSGPVGKQGLKGVAGPLPGQVTLTWKDAETVDNYHLVYGPKPGEYKYGALNIGTGKKYVVKNLVPGKTYYFAVVPVFNNQALYTSQAVAVAAKPAVEVVVTTKEALQQPKQQTSKGGQTPVVREETKAVEKVEKAPDLTVSQAPQATSAPETETEAGN